MSSPFTIFAAVSAIAGIVTIATGAISAVLWNNRSGVAKNRRPYLKGLKPVNSLNLDEYKGLWYEQRRIDSWFEKDLDFVTAKYDIQPKEGFVAVTNSGVKRGSLERVETRGQARQTDVAGYLLVSFFPLIEGAYVVLYLDQNTSVVGSPDRKFLWLLTRAPEVTSGQLKALRDTALANQYTEAQLAELTVVQQDVKRA